MTSIVNNYSRIFFFPITSPIERSTICYPRPSSLVTTTPPARKNPFSHVGLAFVLFSFSRKYTITVQQRCDQTILPTHRIPVKKNTIRASNGRASLSLSLSITLPLRERTPPQEKRLKQKKPLFSFQDLLTFGGQ